MTHLFKFLKDNTTPDHYRWITFEENGITTQALLTYPFEQHYLNVRIIYSSQTYYSFSKQKMYRRVMYTTIDNHIRVEKIENDHPLWNRSYDYIMHQYGMDTSNLPQHNTYETTI